MHLRALLAAFVAFPLIAQDKTPVPAAMAVELRITDDKGGPIQTATVHLLGVIPGQKRFRAVPGQTPRTLAPKDFTGDYALLTDLPVGSHALRIDAELYALAISDAFELPAGRPPRLLVKLTRGAALEGVVTRPDGKPLADADVRTEDAERESNRHPFQQLLNGVMACTTTTTTARTDGEGHYRLEHVARGDYRIVASHFAYAPGIAPLTVTGAVTAKVPPIALAEGVQIAGTVTRGGKPVDGAEVTFQCTPQPAAPGKVDVIDVYYSVVTDQAGRYRLPARVPLGKHYEIAASDEATPLGKAAQMQTTKRRVEVKASLREQKEDVQLPKK